MPNNKPVRKYHAIKYLVASLTAGLAGWKAWLLGVVLTWLFRFLAREGVYFIDIGTTYIKTNMQERDWLKVVSESYEAVEAGNLSESEGAEIDKKFIKAFDNFVVFKRINS